MTVVPPPGYAVSPDTVVGIATEAWDLRRQAIADLNPTELAEVDQPGSEAWAVDRAMITFVAAGNVSREPGRPAPIVEEVFTSVPHGSGRQLLAEIEAADPSCQSGWSGLYLLVIVRPRPTQPWRIAQVASVCTPTKHPGLEMPSNIIDPAPPASMPEPAAQVPGLIAAYWQSWVDHGRPPARNLFWPGPWTTQLGARLASQDRQGSTYDGGIRQRYHYYPAYGSWTFAAQGPHAHADMLVCTTVAVRARLTAAPGSHLYQPPDRHNWGALLAPGHYREIDTINVHPTCALELSTGRLDLFGGDSRPVQVSASN